MSQRPRVYTTEGVILRRRNIGEADTIFTVFSPTEGKFDAVAKGVRKPRSHMRGHLEPLTRSKLLLAHGRTLDVFTQAETITGYRTLREDLDLCGAAVYCAELVVRFTAERQEHRELYELLIDILDAFGADTLIGPRVALKGGTALNVFHSDLDRLSVDIDVNYVGAIDKEQMDADRPGLEDRIERLMESKGYAARPKDRLLGLLSAC